MFQSPISGSQTNSVSPTRNRYNQVSIPYKRVTNGRYLLHGEQFSLVSIPYKRVTNPRIPKRKPVSLEFQSPISGSQTPAAAGCYRR